MKVVYVLGTPRSGSTLVTSLLGELAGVFAAGEIRLLWKEHPRRRCGCGALTQECEIWGEVLERLAGRGITPAMVRSTLDAGSHMAAVPRILTAGTRSELPAASRRHAAVMSATYRLLGDVTGADIIVDSSKSAAEAALLRHIEDVEARVLHIIRDPRAVTYSWHRAVSQGAVGTPDRATWSIALRWALTNGASEAVSRSFGADAVRLRYEDLVRTGEAGRPDLARRLGLEDTPQGDDGRRHIVGGNRLRHSTAPVEIRPDDAWRDGLPPAAAAEVAGLTLPLLRRYGYPVRVRS